MKFRNLLMLAGGSSALILSASADAAYTHLYLEHSDVFFNNHPNETIQSAWLAGPNNQYDIYRLYANFTTNTTDDRINAAYGVPGSPFQVTMVGGTFYNYMNGQGDHYNLPGVSPPTRAWDTWVTIGDANTGGSTGITPGFAVQTNNLGGNTSFIAPTTHAAWFISPANQQGRAVASVPGQANAPPGTYRVLLAQFTVTQGTIGITGNVGINVDGTDMPNQTFFIPAPAALVLLSAAGLTWRAENRSRGSPRRASC